MRDFWEILGGALGFAAALIGGTVTVIFGLVVLWTALFGQITCSSVAEQLHVHYSWKFWGGCYYQMSNGKWVQDSLYQQYESGPVDNVNVNATVKK